MRPKCNLSYVLAKALGEGKVIALDKECQSGQFRRRK
jgi:hypothetical protein